MDAFAVSLAYGSAVIQHTPENTFKVAGFFGGFQAVMPLLGWFLGERFLSYISGFDHWVAFFLLVLVSGRMIYEAFKE
ncbi:manganese efflux pump MntP, partial [candidate division WOR-3 bacterium 4484_100]